MIHSFLYEKDKPVELNPSRQKIYAALHQKDSLIWVDLEDPNEFERDLLVEIFNFHELAVEDCISDISSPKVDDYEEYLFLVINSICLSAQLELETNELDIFLGPNYVVTYHRTPVRAIQQMREALQKKGDLLCGGADLLVHKILDHVVDNYMPILDQYDHKIDELEEHIVNQPPKDYLALLIQLKRDIFNLRRSVSPQRDMIYNLSRNQTAFIRPENMVYFRDVYDHLFRIYGVAEGYHDAVANILQVYFSYQSNKLNEIMKRMTVLATLTMPTVIIASIYGMNFHNMPELSHPYGYLFALLLMAAVSFGMLIWMKLRKWI